MSGSTTTHYTRSAILAWANEILETSYGSFQRIPSHEVALLLYGVFLASTSQCDASAGTVAESTSIAATAKSAEVPLLSRAELHHHHQRHQATCMRHLQLFQFPPAPAPGAQISSADAAVMPLAIDTSATTPAGMLASSVAPLDTYSGTTSAVVQQRNAEHVLGMIRALSAEEAELLRSEASDPLAGGHGNSAANVVLSLGPSMTPAAWLSGGAFVEELKLWRWVRLMAERHCSSIPAVRSVIRAYLQQEGGAIATTKEPAKDAELSATHSGPLRGAASSTCSPVVVAERDCPAEATMCEEVGSVLGGKCARVVTNHMTDEAALPEAKRVRPDMLPSPLGADAERAVATSAASSLSALANPVTPARALLSLEQDAIDMGDSCTDDVNATDSDFAKPDNRMHPTSTATVTPYVAQAPDFQAALGAAQVTLQKELLLRQAQQQQRRPHPPTSLSGCTSHRSSGSDIPDGAGALPKAPLQSTPAMNPCEAHEMACRQHMASTVFPKGAGPQGDSSLASPNPETLTCEVCPSVMAHAIQCNLAAIDNLEDIRTRAIEACLERDPVALLAALQSIV